MVDSFRDEFLCVQWTVRSERKCYFRIPIVLGTAHDELNVHFVFFFFFFFFQISKDKGEGAYSTWLSAVDSSDVLLPDPRLNVTYRCQRGEYADRISGIFHVVVFSPSRSPWCFQHMNIEKKLGWKVMFGVTTTVKLPSNHSPSHQSSSSLSFWAFFHLLRVFPAKCFLSLSLSLSLNICNWRR